MEIWKDVVGYEGLYMVSNWGRVWSCYNSKILEVNKFHNGYSYVNFSIKGEVVHKTIHRLVAKAFIDNPNNLPEVNHIDKNKDNNCVDNLEWCTRKDNVIHSLGKKVMCVETGVVYISTNEAERLTGIGCPNICRACNGKRKTAGGYRWKYI